MTVKVFVKAHVHVHVEAEGRVYSRGGRVTKKERRSGFKLPVPVPARHKLSSLQHIQLLSFYCSNQAYLSIILSVAIFNSKNIAMNELFYPRRRHGRTASLAVDRPISTSDFYNKTSSRVSSPDHVSFPWHDNSSASGSSGGSASSRTVVSKMVYSVRRSFSSNSSQRRSAVNSVVSNVQNNSTSSSCFKSIVYDSPGNRDVLYPGRISHPFTITLQLS